MLLKNTHIPDTLAKAAKQGRLVVFAGSGVSMQQPDPLPNFISLANQLSEVVDPHHRQGFFDMSKESPEAFLGKLDSTPRMREECVRILANRTHSELHEQIIALFGDGEMRIVTTNFDLRFESAAQSLGLSPRIFEGPALPNGDSFTGIVHLHGSIDYLDEMVITDADYGKAYVSDGWASRFLVKMFSEYIVLFVGYSFGDAPMQYLARSISSSVKGRVFVLDRKHDNYTEWEKRGITPVLYNNHDQLPAVFAEWRQHEQRTVFERASLIEAIATSARINDSFERETLVECFSDPDDRTREAFARSFTRAACNFDALKLLIDAGIDCFLFESSIDGFNQILRNWVIDHFSSNSYRELALLAHEANKELSRYLKAGVLRRLADNEASEECLAFWSHTITAYDIAGASALPIGNLAAIIDKCLSAEIAFTYIKIAFVVEARFERTYFGEHSDRYVPSMVLESRFQLDELEAAILKHTDCLGERLFDYCISQLETIRSIETDCGTRASFSDALSFRRSAIEPHEQDERTQGLAFTLIDVARETGERQLTSKAAARRIVSRCIESNSNVVVRIGIHLLTCSTIAPDEALNMTIRNKWLRRHELIHEVFLLLANSYPNASKEARERLLKDIDQIYPDIENRHHAYGRFNILSWLLQYAPDDAALLSKRAAVKEVYPNFKEREYPDLHSYFSASFTLKTDWGNIKESDMTVEAVLNAYSRKPEYNDVRDGKDFVLAATQQHPARALAVTIDLLERYGISESCEIPSIVLRNINWKTIAESDQEQVEKLLRLSLGKAGTYPAAVAATRSAFGAGVFEGDDELRKLELFIEEAFARLDWAISECDATDFGEGTDWLSASLNCAVGEMVGLLDQYATLLLSESYEDECIELERYLARLKPLLETSSRSGNAICARSALSMNKWTVLAPCFVEESLLPQMKPESPHSLAFWQGFSYLNRISLETWDLIKDSLFDCIDGIIEIPDIDEHMMHNVFWLLAYGEVMYEKDSGHHVLIDVALSSDVACKSTLSMLYRYLCQLGTEEQAVEWDGWVRNVFLGVIDDDHKAPIALSLLLDLLFEMKAIREDVATIVSETNCNPNPGTFISTEKLTQLIDDLDMDTTSKAILLSRLVSYDSCHVDYLAIERAIENLNVPEIKDEAFIELRDSIVIRGWVVPDVMRDHSA